ncbi:hypothetical protein DFH07DRAFT_781165 [Mycena maculata]|uniref:Uncharacterized protein n=1 Tax=Mycena maculata TaxID=230809 RepID=A0AAD7HZL9_9AGAR|nr:hypothetical protein DFH07DRAFT_781165 [Mycena maculata]
MLRELHEVHKSNNKRGPGPRKNTVVLGLKINQMIQSRSFLFWGICCKIALEALPLLEELVFTDWGGWFREHAAWFKEAPRLILSDAGFASKGYNGTEEDFQHAAGLLTLPCLRRLVVTRDIFLDGLRVPALDDLRVHNAIDHTLPFLQHSGCVLTRLTLFTCDAEDTYILDILRYTSSLAAFALDFAGTSSTTNQLISVLAVRPDDANAQCLVPDLTSLSWGDRNDTMDRGAFVDIVDSWWRVPDGCCSRLRFVAVYSGRGRLKPKGGLFRIFGRCLEFSEREARDGALEGLLIRSGGFKTCGRSSLYALDPPCSCTVLFHTSSISWVLDFFSRIVS